MLSCRRSRGVRVNEGHGGALHPGLRRGPDRGVGGAPAPDARHLPRDGAPRPRRRGRPPDLGLRRGRVRRRRDRAVRPDLRRDGAGPAAQGRAPRRRAGPARLRADLGRDVPPGPPRAQGLRDDGDLGARLRALGPARQADRPAGLPAPRRADARAGRVLRLDARLLARPRAGARAGAHGRRAGLQGAEVVFPLRAERRARGHGEERRPGPGRARGGRAERRDHGRLLHGRRRDLRDPAARADRRVPAALARGAGPA